MKRRTFILMTLAATAAVTCPIVHNKASHNPAKDPLAWPEDLGKLTDQNTIREIGLYYKKLLPSKYKEEKLRRILLSDFNGTQLTPTDDFGLKEWLKRKIRHDFLTFNMITVNGWVISSTEFRQCALFSLL
ncbi:hypothetical protein [Terrimonas pollutisoli]|uniref:hypothetical protein n=1 Tax=Terrimonas pollutisoli TaxID=3034147 RepID=UPI0023EDCE7D|nr:hypothetical protein [Terrimonas sp. H1YJ31]